MQEPNYFIFGFGKHDSTIKYKNQTKFLLSVRFGLFEFVYDSLLIPVNQKKPQRVMYYKYANLNFGFRQKSFWNVYDVETSRPMYDLNYSPSLYLAWKDILLPCTIPYSVLFGYIHESNGREQVVSRSWDRVFLSFSIGSLDLNPVLIQVDAWYPFGFDENQDIAKHCGVGEVSMYFQPLFKLNYKLSDLGVSVVWKIARDNLLNYELGIFSTPFQFINSTFMKRFTPTFYIQWYYGSGENLIDYKQRHNSFRLGIATLY